MALVDLLGQGRLEVFNNGRILGEKALAAMTVEQLSHCTVIIDGSPLEIFIVDYSSELPIMSASDRVRTARQSPEVIYISRGLLFLSVAPTDPYLSTSSAISFLEGVGIIDRTMANFDTPGAETYSGN